MVSEGTSDGLVDFGEPDCLGIQGGFDGEVQATVPRKERSGPERTVVMVGIAHEGSEASSDPRRPDTAVVVSICRAEHLAGAHPAAPGIDPRRPDATSRRTARTPRMGAGSPALQWPGRWHK